MRERVKEEEQRKFDEEAAREKRREELLLNDPVKIQSRELIPIVKAFLKETAKSFNLILEYQPESKGNPYYLCNFDLYTKDPKSWFFRPQKASLLFSVTVGTVMIEPEGISKEWKVKNVYPIEIFYHDSYYNETKSIARYFIPPSGIDKAEVEKWLEDAFFEKRHLFT